MFVRSKTRIEEKGPRNASWFEKKNKNKEEQMGFYSTKLEERM